MIDLFQVKNILLKHLETAPKEILGNFPRLSREGAMMMISNTEKSLAQGQEPNTKIPSLLEMSTSLIASKMDEKEGDGNFKSRNTICNHITCFIDQFFKFVLIFTAAANSENQAGKKDRKNSGKKTRWGSDDDRVPIEEVMLLQARNQLRLPVSSADQSQSTLTQPVSLDFYSESNSYDKTMTSTIKEVKSETNLVNYIFYLVIKKQNDEKIEL